MGLTANNVLDKVIVTVMIFAFVAVGFPLVNTYLTYIGGNLTGWALVGLFTAQGIIGLLMMIGLVYGIFKIWAPSSLGRGN